MSRICVTVKPEGCKLLRIHAEVADPPDAYSRIESIAINGDFFAMPEEAFEKIEAGLKGCSIMTLGECFERLAAEHGVSLAGIHGRAVQEALAAALAAPGSPSPAPDKVLVGPERAGDSLQTHGADSRGSSAGRG